MANDKGYEEKSAELKYKFDEDYNPRYATGAYGGFQPSGDIVIHFFQDRSPIPRKQTLTFKENDDIGPFDIELKNESPENLSQIRIRKIQNGITMNYSQVLNFNNWLTEKIKEFQEKNGINPNETPSDLTKE